MFSTETVDDNDIDVLGIKQSPSFHDWDNIGLADTLVGNAESLGAVQSVEREIESIDARFEGKLLNAFGKDEEVVLQRFQELRRRQVDLSRRQVELLSRKPRGRFDDTVAGGLEQLAQDMQKLCSMIAEVESLAEPAKRGDSGQVPKDKSEFPVDSSPRDTAFDSVNNSNISSPAPASFPPRLRTQSINLKPVNEDNDNDDDD